MPFLINNSPRWVDYSGFPQKINQEISNLAWPVFKRLMELDSLANVEPDVFSESIERFSQTLGLQAEVIRVTLLALKEQGYIECYIPETDLEPAFFNITVPLRTPVSPRSISIDLGGLQGASEAVRLRYFAPPLLEGNENKFKQILHFYFDLCGLKLNSMVLDDLKELERQFDLDKIKAAFEKAKKNKARSLRPVFAVLYGKEIKEPKKKKQKSEDMINTELL
jgi:hypothetical protein